MSRQDFLGKTRQRPLDAKMIPEKQHEWAYCEHCQVWMVRCGACRNNTCNGGYGTTASGSPCPSCPSAYELMKIFYETKHTLDFKELDGLSKEEYRAKLRSITPIPTPIKLAELDAKIEAYEAGHGLNSDTMLSRLTNGDIEETPEICDWLMDLDLRKRLLGVTTGHAQCP